MFSFLMGIMTLIQKGKSKYKEKEIIYKRKLDEVRNRMSKEDSSKEDTNKKEEEDKTKEEGKKETTEEEPKEKGKGSVKLMAMLTAIIAFFETLPLFFSLMTWGLILLCVIVIVIIVFALMAMLNAVLNPEEEKFDFDENDTSPIGGACGPTGSLLAWTEEELASRGTKLTDKEKNLYRIGILSRNALDGYGGMELMKTEGVTKGDRIALLMGVSSIEDGMNYYTGTEKSVIDYPTERKPNNGFNPQSYGMMGLNVHKKLNNYFDNKVITNIKKAYTPKTSPSYEAQYAPYGLAMSAKHQTTDMTSNVLRKENKALLNKIADDWGIKANRAEFIGVTQIFLAQTHYHGAQIKEYNAYANFFAALFHLTSENDEERTFARWSVETKKDKTPSYAEGSGGFRTLVIGTGTYGMLDNAGTPDKLTASSAPTSYIALNGEDIKEPLWKYVYQHTARKDLFNISWNKAVEFSKTAGDNPSGWGVGARVLNFHYGFNSYLQGKRIEKLLASKMDIIGEPNKGEGCQSNPTRGNFKATPGKGQAVINGKTTKEYMEEYYKKTSKSKAEYLKGLEQYWGTSSYIQDKNNSAFKGGYVDKKFGVPFYGQWSGYKETWGYAPYVPNGNTFYISACMIYAYSYAASAMTGTLINPAEMGSIIHANEGFLGNLIYTRKLPDVYKQMGIQAKVVENGVSFAGFDETLEKGGVVVIRTRPGPQKFTTSQHFQVITGIEKKNGKTYYHMYTSSSHKQSVDLYTKAQLVNNMHKDALLVWK